MSGNPSGTPVYRPKKKLNYFYLLSILVTTYVLTLFKPYFNPKQNMATFVSQDNLHRAFGVYLDSPDGTTTHPALVTPADNSDLTLSPADKLALSKTIWDMRLPAIHEVEAFRILHTFVYDANYEALDGEIFIVGQKRAYRQVLSQIFDSLKNGY